MLEELAAIDHQLSRSQQMLLMKIRCTYCECLRLSSPEREWLATIEGALHYFDQLSFAACGIVKPYLNMAHPRPS